MEKDKEEDITVDFDDALVNYIGEFGPKQRTIYILLSFALTIAAYNHLNMVFIVGVPNHRCQIPANITQHNAQDNSTETELHKIYIPQIISHKTGDLVDDQCRMYDYGEYNVSYLLRHFRMNNGSVPALNRTTTTCNSGWHYDQDIYSSTLVSKFDLVCGRKIWVTTSKTVYMAGLLIGCLVCGNIADRLGRRPTLLFAYSLLLILSIGVAFITNMTQYVIIRFFIGACTITGVTVSFVANMEIVGPNWRTFAGVNDGYFWNLGMLTMAFFAYITRDWFILHWLLTGVCSISLLYYCFVPESARWLYATSHIAEGKMHLDKIAQGNGRLLRHNLKVIVKKEQKGLITDLVRTPNIRKITFILAYLWFVVSLVYFGLSLNTSDLAGSPYLNFTIGALIEIPTKLVCQWSFNTIGRRLSLAFGMCLSGLALLSIVPLPIGVHAAVTTSLTMAGRFGVSIGFTTVYQMTGELYPTGIRAIGVSIGSMFARVGGILAPIIYDLGDLVGFEKTGVLIFGACSLLAGLLSLMLPETKGRHLPESIEDGENFRKNKCPGPEEKRNDVNINRITAI